MSNKFLEKIAESRTAKLVAKVRTNKYAKGALIGGTVAKTGVSIYAGKKLYEAHKAKKEKQAPQEKQAFVGMSADRQKDLVNTATIGAAGGLTNSIANKILHPNAKGEGMKAFALGTGIGLVGDYAAVKLNKVLNRGIDSKNVPPAAL